MPGQWTECRLYLCDFLVFVLLVLYLCLWVAPVVCLSLPFTLPMMFWKPDLDLIIMVSYAPLSLYDWTVQTSFCIGVRRQRCEKKLRRLEPAALPSSRQRRLSQGRIKPQTQSSFLTRLPPEIRQIVYEEVIRDGTLYRHIIELPGLNNQARNRLCGIGCKQNHIESCDSLAIHDMYNVCCTLPSGSKTRFRKPWSNCGPLALAKSCRQIYLETIDMFYGQWTLTLAKP